MSTEDVIKVQVQFEGEEEGKRLQAQVKSLETELKKLRAEFKNDPIGFQTNAGDKVNQLADARKAFKDFKDAPRKAEQERLKKEKADQIAATKVQKQSQKEADAQAKVAGDAKRDRIDAYAKADDDANKQKIRDQKQAQTDANKKAAQDAKVSGDQKRQRIDAYAKAEDDNDKQKAKNAKVVQDAADKKAKDDAKIEGDAKRARIDAYAQTESDNDKQKAKDARNQAIRDARVAGKAKRDRIDAYAKAEDDAAKQQVRDTKADAVTKAKQARDDARAARAAAKAKKSGIDTGRATMEIARGVEDAQYGVAGVINNVPGIVQALGGPAGLVGTLSLAAVGAYQLYRHWDDLMTLFGGGKTLSEAKAMEELAGKVRLTADETDRLNRYNAVQGKAKEIANTPTEAQGKQDTDVTKAIVEAGADNVVKGLLSGNNGRFDSALPGITDKEGNILKNDKGENRNAAVDLADAQRKLDYYRSEAGRTVSTGRGESQVQAIDPEALQSYQNAREEARKALEEARKGAALEQAASAASSKFFPGGLAQLRGEVDANPEKFGPGGRKLGNALKEAAKSPEDIEDEKAQEHFDKVESEWQDRFNTWKEEGRKNEDQRNKDIEVRRFVREEQYQKEMDEYFKEGERSDREEDINAEVQDEVTRRQKTRDDGNRKSEILSPGAALQNAIQGAVKGPDMARTATEQLSELREIKEGVRKLFDKRSEAARAG